MKSFAHIVACRDEDILDRCVLSISRQVDQVVVAIGECWWDGFVPHDKDMKVREQVDLVRGLGLTNVDVIQGKWRNQASHRTACLRRGEQLGMEQGDVIVKVDSDEFFRDEQAAELISSFESRPELMSLCVPRMDFWSPDRVLCDKREYPYSHHMQAWRHSEGAFFRPTMTLCFKDGTIYPHNRLGKAEAEFAPHGVFCYHYDGLRTEGAARLKFDAFVHRRKGSAVPIRSDFFSIWRDWQEDRESVESTEEGIATERGRWVGTMHVDVAHPEAMHGYLGI